MSRFLFICFRGCCLGLIASYSFTLAAADDDKSKIKFDGFVRSMLDIESKGRGEIWHEGRLSAKSKRKNGFRGEVELEFETRTDSLEVLEAVIDRKLEDKWRWEAGYTQKRVGVEYEENRLERATIDRTMMYRRLELFNYVGRENVVRLRKEDPSDRFNDWSLAAGFSESENGSLIGNWQTALPGIDARYGLWAEVGTDKIQDGVQTVFVLMNSLWHRSDSDLWQLEWAIGLDPQQSEFERIFANSEKVYFSGLNVLWGRRLSGDELENWSSIASATVFIHDHRQSAYNSLGIVLGVRYVLEDLRLSLTGEVIGTNSPVDVSKRTYDESSAKLEAIYVL